MTTAMKPRSSRLRFSMQLLILFVTATGSFMAGWVAHRSWNRQNLDRTISEAMQRLNASPPVRVKDIGSSNVIVPHGDPETSDAIHQIFDAAGR